jgi:hypothetical protein
MYKLIIQSTTMKFISILATLALPLLAKSNNEDYEVSMIESTFLGKGDAICRLSNDWCFPNTDGVPTCCNNLGKGGNCKNGARTPTDLQCEPLICQPERFGCYNSKFVVPKCCKQNVGCTIYNPPGKPPCDAGLDGPFEDQLAEFNAEFDAVYEEYNEDTEGDMDVDSFETQGYLRG